MYAYISLYIYIYTHAYIIIYIYIYIYIYVYTITCTRYGQAKVEGCRRGARAERYVEKPFGMNNTHAEHLASLDSDIV